MNPPPKGTTKAGEAPPATTEPARPMATDSNALARNLYELHNWLSLKRR